MPLPPVIGSSPHQDAKGSLHHSRLSIELLDPRNACDVTTVADLHGTYLGDSPVVKLGERFLRQFYYVRLIEDELVRCRVCQSERGIVGFAAYTAQPFDFMSVGLRNHFLTLTGLMLLSLAKRPAMMGDILFVLRLLRQLRNESHDAPEPGTGELLSLVVLPEFQDAVLPGGTSRLPLRLIEAAMSDLRRAGLRQIQFTVQPSNRAANILYSAMGCSFKKVERASGAVHRYGCSLNDGRAENFA